jgi:hypothetical protein
MHWIRINTQAQRNFKEFEVDGTKLQRYFTYQSRREIQLNFPYWTYKQVRGITERLVEKGVLFACNFNKKAIDKTLWYAFVNLDEFNLYPHQVTQMYKNSNNSHDCPNGQTLAQKGTPIPDTKTTDTLKKKKKEPSATAITLNPETKKFEGISSEDLKRWQDTFPAVNIRKELQEALLWALNTPRKNYRRSLDVWMANVNKTHTTPFKEEFEAIPPATEKDALENKKQGDAWEDHFSQKRNSCYDIQSSSSKITFILPNNESYSVDYHLPKKEFLRLCQRAIVKMNLPILPLMP